MGRSTTPCLVLACVLAASIPAKVPGSGQEARTLSLGLSAGPGAVQLRGGTEIWTFGPLLGGRLEWGDRRSALRLSLDAQPFRGEGTLTSGDFRALYVTPAYAVALGPGGRSVAFGLGMGVFDFQGGAGEEGVEMGFVASASGSVRIAASYFVELRWRRVQNVKGLRANVWSLQLLRLWPL